MFMGEHIYESLRRAILTYDNTAAAEAARSVVREGLEPLRALDVMTQSIRDIGDRFGKGELYLPDLVGASGAMLSAMPIIDEALKRRGERRTGLGTVVAGTVYGDIHTIGKTMVATLLMAAGFSVYDIGVNILPEAFVDAVQKHNADILCMSALMTTTAPEQKKTIEALKETGNRKKVNVMVGGSAITQEFADSIGADGYDPIAPGAVDLAKKLMASREEGT
jgi:methanogenic corrinoid protein MtbC1